MKLIRFAVGSFLFVAFLASVSTAQVQRTFVSGLGSDNNPCSRTAPCRTFGQAISQTNPGGEVIVLDSAGYGPFSISQAVSIIAPPGTYAGISVFSGVGIDINAGASDTVILRGLTVNNQGSTGSGIFFSTGGTLHVENCVVNGFSSVSGLAFNAPGTLEVKDSIIRGNGNGIVVMPTSGTATAAIDQVRMEGNLFGLFVTDGARATVRNSLASNNSGVGFVATSASAASTDLNIENCVASNNGEGIHSDGTSTGVVTVRVSNSTITDNGMGMVQAHTSSLVLSRGNNTVEGNTTNTSGTIGPYTAK